MSPTAHSLPGMNFLAEGHPEADCDISTFISLTSVKDIQKLITVKLLYPDGNLII
jgi:hypothetical protein